MCPVSGRLSGPLRPEGTDQHVPVSRCVSAAGISFSVILFPPRDSALLTVGLPNPRSSTGPDLDRVPAFRTHEQRPGWLPLYPGDGGAHPDRKACPAGTCRIPSGQSLTSPPPTIRRQGPLDEASTRGSNDFSRPVFPSPGGPRTERNRLGLFLELRTPPTKSRTTHVEEGTGHSSTDLELHAQHIRVDPPIGSSLITCDLASHRLKRQRRHGCQRDRSGACSFGMPS